MFLGGDRRPPSDLFSLMYTWEIKDYFEKRNFEITDYSSFHQILLESPQINLVQLLESNDDRAKYYVRTNDGYDFIFHLNTKKTAM